MVALLLLLAAFTSLSAQVILSDTARGLVGGELRLPFRHHLDSDSTGTPVAVRLVGSILLSNPTVFYPERILAPAGDSVTGFTLVAIRDSIYTFSLDLLHGGTSSGDTLFYLEGEALAGSDSLCILRFSDVQLQGSPASITDGTIITRSIGPPLPYVRFAILEQNYPNPVHVGGSTTWAYRIDKVSDIRFIFFNVLGQVIFEDPLGEQPLGPHIYTYTPEVTTPAGVYFVRLVTNSGSADNVMHIIR
jgi:hypothetical protein